MKKKDVADLTTQFNNEGFPKLNLFTPAQEKELGKKKFDIRGSGTYFRLNKTNSETIEVVSYKIESGKAIQLKESNLYFDKENLQQPWSLKGIDKNVAKLTDVSTPELRQKLNEFINAHGFSFHSPKAKTKSGENKAPEAKSDQQPEVAKGMPNYPPKSTDEKLFEGKAREAIDKLKGLVSKFAENYEFIRYGKGKLNEKKIKELQTNVLNALNEPNTKNTQRIKEAISRLDYQYKKDYERWAQVKENSPKKSFLSFFNKDKTNTHHGALSSDPDAFANHLNKTKGNEKTIGDHHATRLIGLALQEIYESYPSLKDPTSKVSVNVKLEKPYKLDSEQAPGVLLPK